MIYTVSDKELLREARIPVGGVKLDAILEVPAGACGVALFAHGSGSGRFSPRNRQVAEALREQGVGTLLLDLLTAAEAEVDERTREHRFNIPLLAERVIAAGDWLTRQPQTRALPLGYYGASTGAAAALVAAARRNPPVAAIVSRGGRVDLAGDHLPEVRAPTLMIVGELDVVVLHMNRVAQEELHCASRIEIVPGAGHLFAEPGALQEVGRLSADWFRRHLAGKHVA